MIHEVHRDIPAGLFLRFLLDRPRAFSVGLMLLVLPMGILAMINWLMSSMDGKGPDFDTILAKGRPVTAEVLNVELDTSIIINNRNPVRITYVYEAGGEPVTDTIQTMAVAGYHLEKGQRVTALTYDGDSILPDFPPVSFPWWAIAIIDGSFFVMAFPFLLFAVNGALSKWRLYRSGKILDGEIDSLAPALSIPFTATRMYVAFTCTTEDGRALKGASVVVADENWKGKRRGSAVKVLVSHEPPETSCVVEEEVLARCTETVR